MAGGCGWLEEEAGFAGVNQARHLDARSPGVTAHPILWGSSLTPLGWMSNTDCLLALLWLLTAAAAGRLYSGGRCRPAGTQECFPAHGPAPQQFTE